MAVGSSRPAISRREPAGCCHQYRYRGGRARAAGRLHASADPYDRHNQRDGLRQTQFQFHPRRGEVGYVLVLAASRDQARVVFDYAKAFLDDSPVLKQEIASVTATEIRLRNDIIIGTQANSFRSIRGRTLLAVVSTKTNAFTVFKNDKYYSRKTGSRSALLRLSKP